MTTLGELTNWRPRRPGHDGKVRFKSAGAAQAAIRGLMRRGERETGQVFYGAGLEAYRCKVDDTSGHWHIGHAR